MRHRIAIGISRTLTPILILVLVLEAVLFCVAVWRFEHPRPNWTGDQWECPAGYSVYASEVELGQGKDWVHCVK